jgi:hypothetical protein
MDFDHIRKLAALDSGRRVFEAEPMAPPARAEFVLKKAASADQELLSIAAWCGQDILKTYEALGGRYSHVL